MSRDAFPFFCTANYYRRAAKLPAVPDHDSQLSSVTPSQSASQIHLPGSDESAQQNLPGGSFSLEIPAAHSIDDHGAVHHNIPSSRLIIEDLKRKKAENSDSDDGGKFEVRKNTPFAHPPRNASPRPPAPEKKHTLIRHPSNAATVKSASTLRPSSAPQSNIRLHKQKPASDLGSRPNLVAFKPGETAGTPFSSSGSLLGTITGLFKGKRASAEYNTTYTGPTAASFGNMWQTRTGRNLARSRKHSSSSEEGLPSSVKSKSKAFAGEDEHGPKRSSTMPPPTASQSKSSRAEHSPDKGKGRVPLAIPGPTSATSYTPQVTLERSTSSARSRETAANTALNSRTNGRESFHGGELPSVGRSDSMRSATSSASGRRREPQMGNLLNTVEETLQSGGGRSNGSSGGGGGGGLVLPPAKLEVVRAPPSVTQAPVLLSPAPSPLVLPPGRKGSSGPGSRGAPSPPPKHSTANAGRSFSPVPTSPRGNAFYTTTTTNGDPPRPLKSALRNSSLSPSPSPTPGIHGSVDTSTTSSSGTPTAPASPRPPEILSPIPRPPPPSSMPSGVLPRPNRLSDIPASNRSSMFSENEYETCTEDFGDAEEGSESVTPPASLSPLPGAEKPKHPPEGERPPLLLVQRSTANGTPPVDASVSSSSTQQRKSVRMIIHPTVTVSAPEEYTEPPTPPAYDKGKEVERYKATGSGQSHSRSTSASGTSHRSEVSRGAVPSAWDTRVGQQRSVWDDSEPEDEDYQAAKSALRRASAL
jgi:hypothetical protein